MKSYIGVTGFTDYQQVQDTLGLFPPDSDRLLMVGVLASAKTLRGEPNKKWPSRYPKVEDIKDIFPASERTLNLIHYAGIKTETLVNELSQLVVLAGENLHGFQLNTTWPDPSALAEFRSIYPNIKFVLPITSKGFRSVNHSPEELASKIERDYNGLIDYILLDPSGGKGESIDLDSAEKYLSALEAKKLDIGLGFAGGFGPDTVENIAPLAKNFPNSSIDAEGKTRNKNDEFHFPYVEGYINKGLNIYS